MVPKQFMIVAGEPSGDLLAADLVRALREELAVREADSSSYSQPLHASLAPRFFGAGGPAMAREGVELLFDMTRHAVVGFSDALKKILTFRRFMGQLVDTAVERNPHAIICVDFSGFNLRLAHAIRATVARHRGAFFNWHPKIVQFVSPQVWASRPRRARRLARDADLLLSIFPFEKEWYASRAPKLQVEFVGHPIIDRYAGMPKPSIDSDRSLIVFLPGSRAGELRRHVPVMSEAARLLDGPKLMILPNAELKEMAERLALRGSSLQLQVGGLAEALSRAALAVAATGTVTMECAYFGVPTVAMYKTSGMTYQIGKRIIQVNYLAMPNLLAGEELFPEFVQDAATPENLARAAKELLGNPKRRLEIRNKLAAVIASLGGPGASRRAARAIAPLVVT